MPIAVIMLLMLLTFSVHGAPQFSQAECQKLNAERLDIKKKLRQPHDMAQAKKLQQPNNLKIKKN